MADNKLSWTELRRALASRAGVSEKAANVFLAAFNSQLTAALKSDKQVKVNGLGTFKLQAVAPRKSVNVTTGEQITIEGYNKIAFVPEAGVRELVEKGVKSERVKELKNEGETVDPLKKLGAQAEEIVGLLGELGQDVKQTPKKKAKKKPKAVKPVVEEPKVEEPVPVVAPEPEPIVEPEPEPVVVPKPVEEKPKKKYHFMRDTLICVVVLLMLLLAGYFFLRSQLSGWINELVNPTEQVQNTEYIIPSDKVAEEPSAVNIQPAEPATEEWSFDEILLTEQIAEGSRLAWIAKKHYGNKAYWPYIYAANKDHLTNPSVIPVGTPIRVPKLNAAMRDTTDIRFQQLKEEALEAMK
jgi:nucleoid DNA-binding protein